MRCRRATIAAIVLGLVLGVAACGDDEARQLRLMYAGSLVVPFGEVADEFERTHPGVDVVTEAHGSIQVLRHVTELGDRMDLVASADEQLIPPLMYERDDPQTGEPYASWSVRFATNTLVLAVSPKSPHAEALTSSDWWQAIRRPDVRIGLSDPRFDAAGYRGLMTLQLAERHYGDPYIFEDVVMGQFTSPLTTEKTAAGDVIHVPEVLETRPGSRLVLRGGSVAVLALLESGDVDCAFEYMSVATQHRLPYATLPAALDMSRVAHRDEYRSVTVELDFKRFASVRPVFRGDVIYYAFTVPANAPSPELAYEFVDFLLGPEGQRALDATAQPVVVPPVIDHPSSAPEEVRRACGLSR